MTAARTTRPSRGRRRALLGLLTAFAGIGMAFAGELPEAAAHIDLIASAPRASSRGGTPEVIRLTFSDTVEPTVTNVSLTVDGAPPVTLPSRVDKSDVLVTPPAPAGGAAAPQQWKVAYRVVSKDGHPVIGNISFTVTAPPGTPTSPATPDLTPSPAASATSSAPAAPTPASASPASTVPAGFTTRSDSHPNRGLPFLLVMGVLLLVGPVLAGLVQLLPAHPQDVGQPPADGPASDASSEQLPPGTEGSPDDTRPAVALTSKTDNPVPAADATTDSEQGDGDQSTQDRHAADDVHPPQ